MCVPLATATVHHERHLLHRQPDVPPATLSLLRRAVNTRNLVTANCGFGCARIPSCHFVLCTNTVIHIWRFGSFFRAMTSPRRMFGDNGDNVVARQRPIAFFMSVHLSIHRRLRIVAKNRQLTSSLPHVSARLPPPPDGFPWNLILRTFNENMSKKSDFG
jgi:hypothetical protein